MIDAFKNLSKRYRNAEMIYYKIVHFLTENTKYLLVNAAFNHFKKLIMNHWILRYIIKDVVRSFVDFSKRKNLHKIITKI